jgi:ABC-type multidrug transport system fused ATPase/permease subunit
VREYSQDFLREQISVVSQNTHLFNGTLTDNLRLANPETDEHDVIQAARQAHIHDFIETLPQAYQARIGEQGLLLSAGERQRLAIARAILKNAPIIVFDEATANLDALTEKEILNTIWSLAKNKTVLMITHRLAGLENVDTIHVLQEGRIVESGGHDELLQKRGTYFHLSMQQIQL